MILTHDIPAAGLRAGDLGAIVMCHTAEDFEVEFASASGHAQAVVTLAADDARPVRDDDVLSVRPATPSTDTTSL